MSNRDDWEALPTPLPRVVVHGEDVSKDIFDCQPLTRQDVIDHGKMVAEQNNFGAGVPEPIWEDHMTLDQYVTNRSAAYDGFRRWMRERLPETAEVSLEGWDKLFKVWETMMDEGAEDPAIDTALKAMVGGWYTKKG